MLRLCDVSIYLFFELCSIFCRSGCCFFSYYFLLHGKSEALNCLASCCFRFIFSSLSLSLSLINNIYIQTQAGSQTHTHTHTQQVFRYVMMSWKRQDFSWILKIYWHYRMQVPRKISMILFFFHAKQSGQHLLYSRVPDWKYITMKVKMLCCTCTPVMRKCARKIKYERSNKKKKKEARSKPAKNIAHKADMKQLFHTSSFSASVEKNVYLLSFLRILILEISWALYGW